METFARVLDRLVYTQSRNRKIALLADYFRSAPDPDRGWALCALTDGLPLRLPLRRVLGELIAETVDLELYRLSRDYVGDTAETVALLWQDRRSQGTPPSLGEVIARIAGAGSSNLAPALRDLLDALDATGRWALLKVLGGAPRVGVSARLAKTALAAAADRQVEEIEEIWHALDPPYGDLFAWLFEKKPRPDPGRRPVFRPLMLAHSLEDPDRGALDPQELVAEWKWDGIRVQVSAVAGAVRIFSRTGDDISPAFPELRSAFAGLDVVADGELLVVRNGLTAPFNDLQQRLNRKSVTEKMIARYPGHIRLYDLLFADGADLRGLPFSMRRSTLEAWHAEKRPPRTDLSPLVSFASFAELDQLWRKARAQGIEGLMLKRKDSPYLAGRIKGHWWKWKRAPLTLDCVLMYAQRGSGKRSSYYSDYTFGVWRTGAEKGRELVPVGKAYFGFTEAELRQLDQWIRNNTAERFGPVRAVRAGLVLEVAFDAVHPSTRHKSGVAMRFPRIHRIRWDKPAEEADTLETVMSLLEREGRTEAEPRN